MGIVREEWNETLAVRACLGDWLLVSRGWRKGTRGKQGGRVSGWREMEDGSQRQFITINTPDSCVLDERDSTRRQQKLAAASLWFRFNSCLANIWAAD